MRKNNQKGVSLLLTLLIMAAILVIAFGVSRISIGEIRLTRDISKSVIAYYAADSGVERAIYEKRIGGGASDLGDCSINLDNGSSYGVQVQTSIIKSIGCYRDIRRAIEISF